jgi:hypothetical protein
MLKYSMLHSDGRNNYQTDWDTVEKAIKYYEKNKVEWAIIVECSTGKVVHNKSKDFFTFNMEV